MKYDTKSFVPTGAVIGLMGVILPWHSYKSVIIHDLGPSSDKGNFFIAEKMFRPLNRRVETREFTATELELDINRRYACLKFYWATANTNMRERKQEWKWEGTPKMKVKILEWAAHCMCS